MVTTRIAACQCGQLAITCMGEPVRVSACHCHDCQRRSGSVFAVQARFQSDHVEVWGEERVWERVGDSGNVTAFHFCPACGSTVYYRNGTEPDLVAVPVGSFADSAFPQPNRSVYEERKHPWLKISGAGIEHFA